MVVVNRGAIVIWRSIAGKPNRVGNVFLPTVYIGKRWANEKASNLDEVKRNRGIRFNTMLMIYQLTAKS
ncbi:MAG: hypothetical protein D0531_09950 [Methylococcales bacterium]|nr:MAG: hypothetical protein D0531_09950 [Methylococcales bacterium]